MSLCLILSESLNVFRVGECACQSVCVCVNKLACTSIHECVCVCVTVCVCVFKGGRAESVCE